MDKMIQFERVKKILISNVQAISHRIGVNGGSMFSFAATALIGAAKSYADGAPVRACRVALMIQDKIREFIKSADVRCVGELMELLPRGYDSRLPGWLYGPVDAYFEDEGWVLVPRAA